MQRRHIATVALALALFGLLALAVRFMVAAWMLTDVRVARNADRGRRQS
jgi:hypothetical protein